jgi:hypothetical protein
MFSVLLVKVKPEAAQSWLTALLLTLNDLPLNDLPKGA